MQMQLLILVFILLQVLSSTNKDFLTPKHISRGFFGSVPGSGYTCASPCLCLGKEGRKRRNVGILSLCACKPDNLDLSASSGH